MKCTKKDGESRLCPYRVFREEHKPALKGSGLIVTQDFYKCMKIHCVAYDESSDECMRLNGKEDK